MKRPPAPLPSAPAGETGTAVDRERRRGRGAHSNASGRYEPLARVAFDDGWQNLDDLPPFKTSVTVDATRKIITRNDSPDISFDRSINPYRGCEHGCVYCFARPTHAYLGLSPGLDFESKLFMKPNAPELLERELSAPGYVPKIIAIGTNTDPYQPIERRYQIMRRILEVLERAGHPVGIVTKSALVLRDLDILARMAKRDLVKVAHVGDDARCASWRAPWSRAPSTPPRRLEALRQLVKAGVPTSTLVAPVIPAINDAEIERILEAVAATGVRHAGYVLLRLPLEVRDLFREWLMENFPDRYRPRVQAHPRHARRQGLRFDVGQADDRRRSDRLDDRPPLRSRLRAARLQRDQREDHDRAFPAAAAGDGSSSACSAELRPSLAARIAAKSSP